MVGGSAFLGTVVTGVVVGAFGEFVVRGFTLPVSGSDDSAFLQHGSFLEYDSEHGPAYARDVLRDFAR